MEIQELYRIYRECTCVTTDSRNCPQGSLFFALKGETFNGNAFAAKALEQGSAYAVVDEAAYAPAGDTHYIKVDDCLRALQLLANRHRRTLGTRIIGITGTNGKTTTKELIAAVLSRRYHVLYTQGNLNNQIGVPLTLLRLTKGHDLAVIEMGASHPGDIRELVEIVEPDYGIITNVGTAHLEGFGSFEGVIRTKGELFDFLRTHKKDATVFVHRDNPYLMKIAHGLKQITYGYSRDALWCVLKQAPRGTFHRNCELKDAPECVPTSQISGKIEGGFPYLSFQWQSAEETELHTVQTQLIGDYNLPNALAAITIGRYFGVPSDQIDKALNEYTPQNNRSQLKQTADNTLIIDAYNANPTSMAASIGSFHKMQADHKLLILGDMRELGKESAAEHQKVIDYIEQCGFREVILVGEQFAATRHSPTYRTYPDAPALIFALKQQKPTRRTILIKGSNGIKLASVIDYL